MSNQSQPSRSTLVAIAERLSSATARMNREIQNGKIEGYVSLALAFLAGAFGLFTQNEIILLTAILSLVMFIVFNLNVQKESKTDFNQVLQNRHAFTRSLSKRIAEDRIASVWMYGPSLVEALQGGTRTAIRDEVFKNPRGEVRILIQDQENIDGLKVATDHLDNTKEEPEHRMELALPLAINSLQEMARWKRAEGCKFDYRFLAFSPGFSLIVLNARQEKSVVVVEFHGFSNRDDNARMHIEITPQDSPEWYNYWVDQFEAMWNSNKFTRQP